MVLRIETMVRLSFAGLLVLMLTGCSIAYLPSEQVRDAKSGAEAVTLLPSTCADGTAGGLARNVSDSDLEVDVVVDFVGSDSKSTGTTTIVVPAGGQVDWEVTANGDTEAASCEVGAAETREVN